LSAAEVGFRVKRERSCWNGFERTAEVLYQHGDDWFVGCERVSCVCTCKRQRGLWRERKTKRAAGPAVKVKRFAEAVVGSAECDVVRAGY